jgi:hypothetical protein
MQKVSFGPLTIAQSHARATAVLVNETNQVSLISLNILASFCQNRPLLTSGCNNPERTGWVVLSMHWIDGGKGTP